MHTKILRQISSTSSTIGKLRVHCLQTVFTIFPPKIVPLNVHAAPNFFDVFNASKNFAPDFVNIQHKWKIKGTLPANCFYMFPPKIVPLNVHAAPNFFDVFNTSKSFATDFVTTQREWKIKAHCLLYITVSIFSHRRQSLKSPCSTQIFEVFSATMSILIYIKSSTLLHELNIRSAMLMSNSFVADSSATSKNFQQIS